MIDPAVLPAFVAAVFVVTVAPGPDNTYIAAVAVQHGPAAAALSAIGMAAGMSVHVVVTAVGLAPLISTNALVLVAIQLVGGLYLAGISWTTLAQVGRRTTLDREAPPRDLLRRAVLTNLTNPKVVLFFASSSRGSPGRRPARCAHNCSCWARSSCAWASCATRQSA